MPRNRFSDLRALVVDDDPLMTTLIAMLLRDCGFVQVEIAGGGQAALEHLSRRTVHLLICDLNMPGMDGVQLMSRIAALEQRPAIILVSGEHSRILDSSRQFAEAKQLTLLGVLRKPVARDPLISLLDLYRPEIGLPRADPVHAPMDAAYLSKGIGSGAARLRYQPKIDLRSGELIGVEALLHWTDPTFGVVPSVHVVDAAERCDLIDELTLVVLAQAAHDRRTAADKGIFLNFAINVSLKNLRDADIVERMLEAVASELGEPADFTLEITETHLVDDLAKILEPLLRLRLFGFKISLDDYGTGASSMQLLSQLPSTELKIDRSFVTAAPRSMQGRAFMQSAVELGLQMGQSIVAEGIETEEERALALELGCEIGQGYLFSRPLIFEDLVAMAGKMPQLAHDAS
ncbi:diguanylate phosphodiesterase [Pseudoxanthomonas yeongjuensis]|jgi:EAL domain-containing protein (putative c-di-GMP-specific phosphodiesterase class I)|uniref:EAL domain-containing response regulator n=1 Tax=Pseudoxanthomonas yeongjuensis TaxID=377616 RepID=UPI00248353A4|nr:EAL domain-containing response regulator [Pseudoxanthomonas yeongjuensis]KAF1717894.1 diguanylate phosphodiesterase [Pseudoxanthomonas yeongjuensis]